VHIIGRSNCINIASGVGLSVSDSIINVRTAVCQALGLAIFYVFAGNAKLCNPPLL